MQNYLSDDSLYAEQCNTLVLVNELIKRENLDYKPVFELVGGTAILLHGIESVFTVDIDCANKLTQKVSSIVSDFVSDMASTVVLLPRLYQTRLKLFEREMFDSISIMLLSVEDLIVTKLAAYRSKDKEDLIRTNLIDKCNIALVRRIIERETPIDVRSKLMDRLSFVLSERELFRCREEKLY